MEGLEGQVGNINIVDRLTMYSRRDIEVTIQTNISTIIVAGANIRLVVQKNFGYINVCGANCKVNVIKNCHGAKCEDQGARNEVQVFEYTDERYTGMLNIVPVDITVNSGN